MSPILTPPTVAGHMAKTWPSTSRLVVQEFDDPAQALHDLDARQEVEARIQGAALASLESLLLSPGGWSHSMAAEVSPERSLDRLHPVKGGLYRLRLRQEAAKGLQRLGKGEVLAVLLAMPIGHVAGQHLQSAHPAVDTHLAVLHLDLGTTKEVRFPGAALQLEAQAGRPNLAKARPKKLQMSQAP